MINTSLSGWDIFTMETGKHARLCPRYPTFFKPEIPPSLGDLSTKFFCTVGVMEDIYNKES